MDVLVAVGVLQELLWYEVHFLQWDMGGLTLGLSLTADIYSVGCSRTRDGSTRDGSSSRGAGLCVHDYVSLSS